MDKFRQDMIEVRAQMEEIINKNSEGLAKFNRTEKSLKETWRHIKHNENRNSILRKIYKVKYGDIAMLLYFIKADIEKQRIIVETLLSSSNQEVMEEVVIKVLNFLRLERKEQLNNIFKGIENLLTENIESHVKIELKSVRLKKELVGNIINTELWITTFIYIYGTLNMLADLNVDFIAVPILFAIPMFLVSSLTGTAKGIYKYREALKDEKIAQN